MDHGDMKLSGDGSIFLLLLNEEDSEETEGLNGKDRLRHAWTFEGELLVFERNTCKVELRQYGLVG